MAWAFAVCPTGADGARNQGCSKKAYGGLRCMERLKRARILLTALAMVIVALRNVLGLDDVTVYLVVSLAIGGASWIASDHLKRRGKT